MHFLAIVVGTIIGSIIYNVLKDWFRKRRLKFGWDCPENGCYFKARTNTLEALERVKSMHTCFPETRD